MKLNHKTPAMPGASLALANKIQIGVKLSLILLAFVFSTYQSFGCETLNILPNIMPDGYRWQPYSVTLSGSGGVGPYKFRLIDPDMYFKLNGNVITATIDMPNNYAFQVEVTDARGCKKIKNYMVYIRCTPITVTPTDSMLPIARVGEYYQESFNGTNNNGLGVRRIWVSGGTIPKELAYEYPYLNTGLDGVPKTPGEYSFTVKVADWMDCTGSRKYHLTVLSCPTPTLIPQYMPSYKYNDPINIAVSTCGGSGEYEMTATNLPPFIKLESYAPRKYHLVGTASTSGMYMFYLTSKDLQKGSSITRQYTLEVIAPANIQYEAWTKRQWPAGKPSLNFLDSMIQVEMQGDVKKKLRTTQSPTNVAENFGSRMVGTLVAPMTAYYTFHIASSNQSKLIIKSGDWVRVLATVPDYTNPGEWTKYPSQHSDPVFLTKGSTYTIEARHIGTVGFDHLQIGWRTPFLPSAVTTIAGEFFKPIKEPIDVVPGPIVIDPPYPVPTSQSLELIATPNRFDTDISVEFSNPLKGAVELQLIDLHGNVIKDIYKGSTQENERKAIEIPYLNIQQGIYLLRLSNGRQIVYKKIIKRE